MNFIVHIAHILSYFKNVRNNFYLKSGGQYDIMVKNPAEAPTHAQKINYNNTGGDNDLLLCTGNSFSQKRADNLNTEHCCNQPEFKRQRICLGQSKLHSYTYRL